MPEPSIWDQLVAAAKRYNDPTKTEHQEGIQSGVSLASPAFGGGGVTPIAMGSQAVKAAIDYLRNRAINNPSPMVIPESFPDDPTKGMVQTLAPMDSVPPEAARMTVDVAKKNGPRMPGK